MAVALAFSVLKGIAVCAEVMVLSWQQTPQLALVIGTAAPPFLDLWLWWGAAQRTGAGTLSSVAGLITAAA